MSYFKKLLSNAKSTYSLEERYFRFTSRIGLLGTFSGLGAVLAMILWLVSELPFDTSLPINQWPYGIGYLFLLIMPISFVVFVLPCCMFFALLASVYMLFKNEMTYVEAKRYVLYGEYPVAWFKSS